MTSLSTLEDDIHRITQAYIREILSHSQNPYLNWCLPNIPFPTGYQPINRHGKSIYKRLINHYLGKHLQLVKRTFINNIQTELNKTYFSKTQQKEHNIPKKNIQIFFNILAKNISNNWHHIHSWNFTDLFSYLQCCCNAFYKSLNIEKDLYLYEKKQQNNRFLKLYTLLKDHHKETPISEKNIFYIVTKANGSDSYSSQIQNFLSHFPEEINQILDTPDYLHELTQDNHLFNYRALLYELTGTPKTILYECDNHGEILLDLFFIETLLKKTHRIILCAKNSPILNDVTLKDLQTLVNAPELQHLQAYIKNKKLQFITHGSSDVIPRRYLMNESYITAYKEADIVILKGQGNFESYPINKQHPYIKPHYHLLTLKSIFSLRSFKTLHKNAIRYSSVLISSNG